MKPAFLLAALIALPLPALAADCNGKWTADMQMDEGGEVMTGYICIGSGDSEQSLSLTCGSEGSMALRWYPPQSTKDYPPDGGDTGFKTNLVLSTGGQSVTQQAIFEEMDSAMSIYWMKDDPLTGMLKSGDALRISDAGGQLPAATFPLTGSAAALAKVTKSCMS